MDESKSRGREFPDQYACARAVDVFGCDWTDDAQCVGLLAGNAGSVPESSRMKSPATTEPNSLPRRDLTVIPYPGRRRPDLATLTDVRREMGKIYREMRFNKIDTQDGTRLCFVLMQIGKMIQTTELEARIDAVERALGQRRKP